MSFKHNASYCNDLRTPMSKRKLSRQQRWRIEKIQAERARRAEQRDTRDAQKLAAGDYGPEQNGRVIAHYGRTLDVQAPDSTQVVRCHLRANLGGRSEERRVGKECRSRGSPYQ